MRVLHLLNHTRRLNGHVHAAVDLACAQVEAGHQVMIASGGGDFDQVLVANGVETELIVQSRSVSGLLSGLAGLNRCRTRWKPDVIHAHMVASALLAWPVCKLGRIPLITTVHNEFQKSAVLMGLGTRVIAVSAAVGQSLQRRGVPGRRLDVILNGTIGSARFKNKARTPRRLDKPAIIFIGGLHPRKGVSDLIYAFETVYKKHPLARLYIVGDGPHRQEYEALVSARDLQKVVIFEGAQDDPFAYLLGADIFVLPSLADPAPLVLSEAREAGCAIIGTQVDGIPEMLEFGRAGLLVPPQDPVRLATAIDALLTEKDTLTAWRAHSQLNIGHMRIDRVVKDVMRTYAAAVGR